MNFLRSIGKQFLSFVQQYPLVAMLVTAGVVGTTVIVVRNAQKKIAAPAPITRVDSTRIENKETTPPPPEVKQESTATSQQQPNPANEKTTGKADTTSIKKKREEPQSPEDTSNVSIPLTIPSQKDTSKIATAVTPVDSLAKKEAKKETITTKDSVKKPVTTAQDTSKKEIKKEITAAKDSTKKSIVATKDTSKKEIKKGLATVKDTSKKTTTLSKDTTRNELVQPPPVTQEENIPVPLTDSTKQIPSDTTGKSKDLNKNLSNLEEDNGKEGEKKGDKKEKKKEKKKKKGAKTEDGKGDSLTALADTLPHISKMDSLARGLLRDSTIVIESDSTERIHQWSDYRRKSLAANPFERKQSALYATINHPAYQREVKLDTTGKFVTVHESWYGKDITIPQTMTLDEYISERLAYESRKMWEDSIYAYHFKNEGKDILGSFFNNITNIDIPVPANPLFSIFGPPRINLRVSGAVDIHAGFRTQKTDLVTTSSKDQTTNDPNFNQEVQVNVNGTIGDKLNILSDWNTQRTFEYENQLKLKYTGYDDEIVQSVEAGNVSMSAPQFFGSSAALFGIKTKMQLGPISLYSLASQKKGKIQEVNVKGGATENIIPLYPAGYATNHYLLDTIYLEAFENYYSGLTPVVNGDISVKDIEVWVSRSGEQPQTGDRAIVSVLDLPSAEQYPGLYDSLRNATITNEDTVVGSFYRLERGDYELHPEAGYISFIKTVDPSRAIAVAYSIGPVGGKVYGEFTGTDTSHIQKKLVLKLIRPKSLLPSSKAWRLQLKNIYNLGGAKNIKPEGFEFKIAYKNADQEKESITMFGQEVKLLSIFGLDQRGPDGLYLKDGDGQFDYIPNITVNERRAEVIFPSVRPFDSAIVKYFNTHGHTVTAADTALGQFFYSSIYDTTQTAAGQDNSNNNKYVFHVKYKADVTARYSLGFNVVEGSVKVMLGGTPLAQGTDYSVDYILGEVIIKNDAALVPGADLKITYEQNDLFQIASKTLLGARAEMQPLPNTMIGATIMNLNQATLSDKVRLGEEPTKNTMMGFDANSTIKTPFITDALNALPLYQTREPSELKLDGEAAYMNPNPNTKKSSIAGETDKSIAYIDDFEGAQRTIPLGTNYSQWNLASPPKRNNALDTATARYRAKLWWYTPPQGTVVSDSIWPKRSNAAGQNNVQVMDLRYFPHERGMYNYTRTAETNPVPETNWGGIMRSLNSASNNLHEQNMTYLEIWMKVIDNGDPNTGKLKIDLGQVSEDIIPNHKLNSEDLVVFSRTNGILNEGEDIGMDMMSNSAEHSPDSLRKYVEQPYDPDVLQETDPSGDDFRYTVGSIDYSHINGYEANQGRQRKPDTEDLNGNQSLDESNDYFEYDVSLDTTHAFTHNPLIVGGGSDGWYQYRIPLANPTSRIGSPTLDNVEYIRVWLTGFSNSNNVIVRIADFNIVGNQWLETNAQDSTFKTSVVNLEDNPSYTIPPGVVRETDKTKPDQNIKFNEQSLALLIDKMPDEQRDSARYSAKHPYPPGRQLDVTNYKEMKMFVHGERYNPATRRGFRYIDSVNYDAEFYIRFGSDPNNFYEYRAPLHPAGASLSQESQWPMENNVDIIFSELSALKQGRDSASQFHLVYKPAHNNIQGARYGVQGFPALNAILYITIGVSNPRNNPQPRRFPMDADNVISGEVWVNELRLVGVEDTPGWAYRLSSNLKLADLGTMSMSYQKTDPYFHSLDKQFNDSKITIDNLNVGASLNLDRFFPQEWQGTTIPITYSYSQSLSKPLLIPHTDVPVTTTVQRYREEHKNADSVQTASESFSVSNVIALPTIHIAVPSRAWYIDQIINRLSFAFNYNTQQDRNPNSVEFRKWGWDGRVGYDLNLPNDYIQPFKSVFATMPILRDFKDYKIYYSPINKVQWTLDAHRDKSTDIPRALSKNTLVSTFRASRSFGFSWKATEGGLLNLNGSYSLSAESFPSNLERDPTVAYNPVAKKLDTINTHEIRTFSGIIQKLFPSNKLVDLGLDSRYGQNVTIASKPTIPNVFDIPKYLDLTAGYRVDYGWSTNLQGEVGQGAGWNNQIDLGMNFKLKQLADTWFPIGTTSTSTFTPQPKPQSRGRGREATEKKEGAMDTTNKVITIPDTTSNEEVTPSISLKEKLINVARIVIKTPILDYDNVSITYSQTNKLTNSGIAGENATGLHNFWGPSLFSGTNIENGPSGLYQLGLARSPGSIRARSYIIAHHDTVHGHDTIVKYDTLHPQLTNDFTSSNKLTFKTSRDLWAGAHIDLNWAVNWSTNENDGFKSDLNGNQILSSVTHKRSGSIDRTFFLMPIPLFKPIKGYLKSVGTLASKASTSGTPTTQNEKIANAFEEGFETFPFLRKVLGEYVPRANYSFRWSGLEKFTYFTKIFTSLSFEHTYTSNFTRLWTDINGSQQTDRAKVSMGFAPLAGLSMTFVEMWKGNLNAAVHYNTTTNYDLAPQASSINETYTKEITGTLGYTKRGFEIPLFGFALQNDIDFSFNYSFSANSSIDYNIFDLATNQTGVPRGGTTRTQLEPRIKYILSSRVSLAIFYRQTSIQPDAGGSSVPGTTTNEAGLDLRIAIQ